MTPEDHASESAKTLAAVKRMEDGLAAGENEMTRYFHDDFLWRGNYGSGTKRGLDEFRRNWQLPLRAAPPGPSMMFERRRATVKRWSMS